MLVCDAQTSGGLLVAVPPAGATDFENALDSARYRPARIGTISGRGSINVRA
jgi:selenophosphate synthase